MKGHFPAENRKVLKSAYYQNYFTDSNQILHSDEDHQILFVGGPNMNTINPKNAKSQQPTATKFGTVTHFHPLNAVNINISNF